jgi:nucleoside-diphosphate-sugar epimerase
MDLSKCKVLVTGGASFIGSHLSEALLKLGAKVRIVDDLSSGKMENIEHINNKVEFFIGNLLNYDIASNVTKGIDIVFHLAAVHGGRGYVDLHQADCAANFILDGNVFLACKNNNVKKIVFASSACVYPNSIQNNLSKDMYLSEDMAGPPYDADNIYGWAKLIGELTLKSYYKDYGIKSASCRFLTVYGNKCHENISILAMIARSFIKQDPFEIWGNGEQIRNWIHVDDIVRGIILSAEKIDDATSINLGTNERNSVIDAAKIITTTMGHAPEFKFLLDMPVGPINRLSNNDLAKKLLGWESKIKLADGIISTIEWYQKTHNIKGVTSTLNHRLIGR